MEGGARDFDGEGGGGIVFVEGGDVVGASSSAADH